MLYHSLFFSFLALINQIKQSLNVLISFFATLLHLSAL